MAIEASNSRPTFSHDKLIVAKKQNAATDTAGLILPAVASNYERHRFGASCSPTIRRRESGTKRRLPSAPPSGRTTFCLSSVIAMIASSNLPSPATRRHLRKMGPSIPTAFARVSLREPTKFNNLGLGRLQS